MVKDPRRWIVKDRFEIALRKVVQRRRYVAERPVGHHMRKKKFGVLQRVFGLLEPYNSLRHHLQITGLPLEDWNLLQVDLSSQSAELLLSTRTELWQVPVREIGQCF